jgi:hypothetical protein
MAALRTAAPGPRPAQAAPPHLEVCAVGAGDELAVGLGSREPGLQVVLLGGGVVQRAAHNVDHAGGRKAGGGRQSLRDRAGMTKAPAAR